MFQASVGWRFSFRNCSQAWLIRFASSCVPPTVGDLVRGRLIGQLKGNRRFSKSFTISPPPFPLERMFLHRSNRSNQRNGRRRCRNRRSNSDIPRGGREGVRRQEVGQPSRPPSCGVLRRPRRRGRQASLRILRLQGRLQRPLGLQPLKAILSPAVDVANICEFEVFKHGLRLVVGRCRRFLNRKTRQRRFRRGGRFLRRPWFGL